MCDNRINAHRPRCDANCSRATGRRAPDTVTHSQSNPNTLYSLQCLRIGEMLINWR